MMVCLCLVAQVRKDGQPVVTGQSLYLGLSTSCNVIGALVRKLLYVTVPPSSFSMIRLGDCHMILYVQC